eukprot:scaffold3390_cov61-Cyclotella_meneghiniana.AAC.9
MWVDPVEGLHPTECLVERSQLILTTGLKIDPDFKLLPLYEEVQKRKKLKPVSKVDRNFPSPLVRLLTICTCQISGNFGK